MTLLAVALCCMVLIACGSDPKEPAPNTPLQTALRTLNTTDWSTLPCQIFQDEIYPMLPPSDRLAPLADLLIPTEDIRLLSDQGITVLWNDGTQATRLYPTEKPGIIQLQYESKDTQQTALAQNMEVYTWMIAASQCPGVELADIDGDGFWESFYDAPTLDIYDYYDGQIQVPVLPDRNTGFVKGCLGSDVLDDNRQFLLDMNYNGQTGLFSYQDGETTFVCTVGEAYLEDAQIDDYGAYLEEPLHTSSPSTDD